MTTELKPGWRWENFEQLRSTVVTAPNGQEYELRAGDITHPRAQRLLDAMFAALTQRPAAQEVRSVKVRITDDPDVAEILRPAAPTAQQLESAAKVCDGFAAPDMAAALRGQSPAAQTEREAWAPYLVDRADGVKGHYAIGRWNPRGYREVWNLHSHRWAAYSDDVMSLEEADSLLRQITIPTVRASLPATQQATHTLADTLRKIDAASCKDCAATGYSDPGVPDSPDGTGRPAVVCGSCNGNGWLNGVHVSDQQATPTREAREAEQRARMQARLATRHEGKATADFDLPAPNDAPQQATPEPVGEVVAWLYTEDGETKFGHPQGHRPKDARPLVFGDTRPAPGVPEDLADLLCSVADNLNDMPISDEYAAKTAKTAYDLLVKHKVIDALAAAQAKGGQ